MRTGRLGRGEQVVGALRAEPVREREAFVEVLDVGEAAQPGHLVDHDIGLGLPDGLLDRRAIEPVHGDRLGPELVEAALPAE